MSEESEKKPDKGSNKGFKGLLSSTCLLQCEIPFQCTTKSFTNTDGSTIKIKVVDGLGQSHRIPSKRKRNNENKDSNAENNQNSENNKTENGEEMTEGEQDSTKEPGTSSEVQNETTGPSDTQNLDDNEDDDHKEEEEEIEFDRKIEMENRTIHGDENDPFGSDIITITDYFRNIVNLLYDAPVTDIRLSFGVKDEGHVIYLLDGDVTTATNGFTKQLLRNEENGEQVFIEFLVNELTSKAPNGKCYSNFPVCKKGNYKCPRIFVVLYRAHQRFSDVDEARLYRIIKSRIQAINPDVTKETVNVCIQCLHLYTAEQRTYQASKETNALPTYVDPYCFEALVPAELSLKGKKDVGMTPDQHRPFSFGINYRDSPYRSKLPIMKKPDKPPPINPPPPIPKSEPWVQRLCSPQTIHTVRGDDEFTTRARTAGGEDVGLPPISPTRKSYSQQLAPKTYSNMPFTYKFLEKMKKKADNVVRRSQQASRKSQTRSRK